MSGGVEERVEALWAAATAGDERAATRVATDALDAGLPMETLLLDVVAAVQSRVGHEWAANRLSVAQEHTATAVNERVLAALAHHPTRQNDPAPGMGRIVVACIDGEWHAFPARLLAEVLRARGWHVDYLGAQVPTPHLVAHLHLTNPDAVALSSSLAIRLPAAHTAISACQAAGTPVVAGGAAFGPDGRYARLLGADAWAPDARTAADLLAAGPLPRQATSGEEPRQLADREYTDLTRSAGSLVGAVMDDLTRRVPAMAGYTEQQLERTAEDVAYLVDFLRAALYVHDPELFSAFVGWMTSVLTARGVPESAVLAALDALAGRLTGFPRALGTLARARTTLG
ncbi:5-methyltetrahydrofolate--homocysteine methyltransferase [[Actinomadura] parvosata subsp. kistnae]|uniref:Cobalamin-binding protein n=1 Tax=[Actinomadura] parvosata subsp. kistnae TaxID=1909395 RepID=A0A1V0AEV3_9ACTN|nr:cobalamin-dependent protein [Nonomuraea sp. ATCC 55076]AQZ68632.1 cobalamin-binding protein [Nonomuraea sp. ATCC 55076]SPL92888.1 5-methyltetrahydrofolate--homocysteine methyltransferase [Actinomadura parvosata subsp. kistnae]